MMADNNTNPLESTEYSQIGRAIVDMVASYTGLPANVTLDYQDMRGIGHIGVFTAPGGRYLRQDVIGCFEAQVPFDIIYCCAAVGNLELLEAEAMLDGLAEYLEQMKPPSLSGGRNILKVTMNSITYRTEAAQDGAIQFRRSGTLRYEKE